MFDFYLNSINMFLTLLWKILFFNTEFLNAEHALRNSNPLALLCHQSLYSELTTKALHLQHVKLNTKLGIKSYS